MQNQASLQETKQHGAVRFPFNLYPCAIPGDFPQVALHWQESMELVFVKRGIGLVQVGAVTCPARMGDIFIFTPGTLHALRQAEGQCMEYENIIFALELLGGAEDLCAEKYLLPLQSGRLSLQARLTPNDLCYFPAAACLREVEEANRAKLPGYELLVKGALLRFLSLLIAQGKQQLPAETADTSVAIIPPRFRSAAPRGNSRHPAAESRSAMALGPLCRGAPGRRCRRGLLFQRQPFHALVPADDRAELRCLSERIPPECRRRGAADHGRDRPDHRLPVRIRKSLLFQPGVQGALRHDPAGIPKKINKTRPFPLLWKREETASFFAHQTSGGGQQLSRGMSLCGTMILVARRFGFSIWLMVWLAASMPSW